MSLELMEAVLDALRSGKPAALASIKLAVEEEVHRLKHPGNHYPWTAYDDAFIKSNIGPMPYSRMARYLNRSEKAVGQRVLRLGLVQKPWEKWAPAEVELLKHYGAAEASRRLGRSHESCRHKMVQLSRAGS